LSGAAIPPIVTETPSSSVGSGTLAADVVPDARLLPKIVAHVPGARLPLYETPFSTPCTTGNFGLVWNGCAVAPLKVCAQADPVVRVRIRKEIIANVILRIAKRRIVPPVFFIKIAFLGSHQMGRAGRPIII
jgi:hypothetical protein